MGKNGKNDGFAHLCKPLLEALRSFITVAAFIGVHAGLRRAIDAAKALESVLEDDLLLETGVAIRGRRSGKFVSKDTYRRRCYKAKGKCQSLKESMNQFKAKVNNPIAWRWMVMAGLGDPTTSTWSVESWCRELAIAEEEKIPISHTSVSAMRDTFGHILLEMDKQDATRYVQGAPHGFVVVRHLHDEATMRLRSKLPSPAAAPAAPALAAASTAAPAPLAAPAGAGPAPPAPAAGPAAPAPAAAPAAPAPAAAAAAPAPAGAPVVLPTIDPLPAPTRSGRYSKVQNTVVTLHVHRTLSILSRCCVSSRLWRARTLPH